MLASQPHIVHVFSTFGKGGPQVRTCTIMNALGREFRHTIVATDNNYAADVWLGPGVEYHLAPPPPGKGSLLYSLALTRSLREWQPDLVLTYNWGAFDAIVAARVSSLVPVVHTEDGFGPDEAEGLKPHRVWARRIVLNTISGVVVPSHRLHKIATEDYRVAQRRLRFIPNGIDVARFHPGRSHSWRDRHGISRETLLIGYAGRLSREKNLPLLLRSFAQAKVSEAFLVLLGDGPCRGELEKLRDQLGLAERVLMPGPDKDPADFYRSLDIFAMSSATEQMPMSLLEAMASGLPCISTDVGDCATLLGTHEAPFVIPAGDESAYTTALRSLAEDKGIRISAGVRNRQCVEKQYSHLRMISEYAHLYRQSIGTSRPVGRS